MRYYIADLHFGHAKLNELMDCRGFETVEAMDEYMIRQWNSRVRPGDEVVILGDFCMSIKGRYANEILDRLHGTKYLIIGNHDKFLENRDFDVKHFKWVKHYEEMKDNKRKVVLSHYPIFCYNGQYRLDNHGNPKVYMLYGHVHNTYDEYLINEFRIRTEQSERLMRESGEKRTIPCQMINCFCMFSDYVPLTLDEWIETDSKRRAAIRPEDYII